jgi:hypothetical protein
LSDEDIKEGHEYSATAKAHAQKHFVATGETENTNIQSGFWSQYKVTVTIILSYGIIGSALDGYSTTFTIAVLVKFF